MNNFITYISVTKKRTLALHLCNQKGNVVSTLVMQKINLFKIHCSQNFFSAVRDTSLFEFITFIYDLKMKWKCLS